MSDTPQYELVSVVRCKHCAFCTKYGQDAPVPGHCRRHSKVIWDFEGFCSDGWLRQVHDGKR